MSGRRVGFVGSFAIAGFVGLSLLVTGPAFAATFNTGDVFAAIESGKVQHYNHMGALQETLDTLQGGFTTGMVFDASGNLYVTDFSASKVSKFSNTGVLLGTFGSGYSTPESIVYDGANNVFYVGNLGNGTIKLDANGATLATYATGVSDWIDLASDHHTLHITREGTTIDTFDLNNSMTGTFATGLTQGFAHRILSDGGEIVADLTNVKRFNAGGTLVQTYTLMGESHLFALNLDPDGTSFWTGDFGTSDFLQVNITTGAVLQKFNTGTLTNTLFGLVVKGEICTVCITAPEPGTPLLFASALVGLVALRGFRKDRII